MTAATTLPVLDVTEHVAYVNDVASSPQNPKFPEMLQLLVSSLAATKGYKVLAPSERRGVHPLVIPLLRDPSDGSVIGLLRQPLKPQIELPVVRTGPKGMTMLAFSVELFVKRAAIEEDYKGSPLAADILRIARSCGLELTAGAAKDASKLGLERFVLTRVGAFPDLYEWLAEDWLSKGKVEEALIACARASGLMPEWGRSHWVHSQILHKVGGRELEARDCARAALQMPLWTIGHDVEAVVTRAEGRGMAAVRQAYLKWAKIGGPEEDFVNTGKSDSQVALGRAGYLLDTVMVVEETTWDGIKAELADHYSAANLPEMARFVRAGI